MNVLLFRGRPEFVRGRTGEQRVAAWLQGHGFYVIPSYDYSGEDGNKAPKLQGRSDSHPIPDLDVARAGTRKWVEVKTKTCAVLWRKTGELRHGIDYRHLLSYRKVEDETGNECWLAIYEQSTGHLLMQSLQQLGEPETGMDRGTRMAYWPRTRFRHVTTLAVR